MNILIVSSSSRRHSESAKIANIIAELYKQHDEIRTQIIDFSEVKIPFWEESIWKDEWVYKDDWNKISQTIKSADGFIFIVPEWAGMVPPQLKNFLLIAGMDLAHKPALIVAISSGVGGSYPILELRMSGFKNTHILWIPDHVIIRKCQSFVLDHADYAFEQKRLLYCLTVLETYARRMIGLTNDLKQKGMMNHQYGM